MARKASAMTATAQPKEAVAVTTRVDQARLDKILTEHDPFAAS